MPTRLTLAALRSQAVVNSLQPATTLAARSRSAGFVQADPIRAPARAQDLILRHRVAGYRVGDLERRFARLGLEEDFLYAYGFMPRETSRLLHPRAGDRQVADVPRELAARGVGVRARAGRTHPTDLAEQFGRERAVNGWGGFSKATTRALQSLHYHGLLRVAGRRDGIRIYEVAAPPDATAVAGREDAAHRADWWSASWRRWPRRDWRAHSACLVAALPVSGAGGRHRGAGCLRRAGERRGRWQRYYWLGGGGAPARRPGARCGCWRRSIRSSGNGGGSSIYGAGSIGSRLTPSPNSGGSAITRCRCLWGYDMIGWAQCDAGRRALDAKLGFVGASQGTRSFAAGSTPNWRRWRVS